MLLLTSSSPTMLYAPTANMDKLGIWWFANRLVFSLPHSGGRGGKPEDRCATVGRRVSPLSGFLGLDGVVDSILSAFMLPLVLLVKLAAWPSDATWNC